jgi:hypothetical protein
LVQNGLSVSAILQRFLSNTWLSVAAVVDSKVLTTCTLAAVVEVAVAHMGQHLLFREPTMLLWVLVAGLTPMVETAFFLLLREKVGKPLLQVVAVVRVGRAPPMVGLAAVAARLVVLVELASLLP